MTGVRQGVSNHSLKISTTPSKGRSVISLRILTAYLRCSPMIGLAPAAAAFLTFYAWPGRNYQPESGHVVTSFLMSGLIVINPLCAGAGAWLSYRAKTRGIQQIRALAIRAGRLDRLIEPSVAFLLVFIAINAAAVTCAIALAMTDIDAGGIEWPALQSTALACFIFIGFGGALGRLLPFPVTPPAAAVLSYIFEIFSTSSYGDWWTLYLPVLGPTPQPFYGWRNNVFSIQLVWFIGAAVLIVICSLWRDLGTRSQYVTLSVTVAVIVTSVVLISPFKGRWESDSVSPFTYDCSGSSLSICTHPAFTTTQAELHTYFDPLQHKLADTPSAFSRLEQRPRGIDGAASTGSAAFHLDSTDQRVVAGSLQEFVESLLNSESCFSESAVAGRPYQDVVAEWLLNYSTNIQFASDRASRDWFQGLSEASKAKWLAEHYEKFSDCALSGEDFR